MTLRGVRVSLSGKKQKSRSTDIAGPSCRENDHKATRGSELIVTLIEVINLCREDLADESLGVRRSWEDMFRYTLRHYTEQTALRDFDPDDFSTRLLASEINPAIVNGYVQRWREILRRRGT